MSFLLSGIHFGVWSLQTVSVNFVPLNLFDLAEWHLLWCLISTVGECWCCGTKSVWFCWVASALVSDLYRQWVLILYHQICLILLSDICSGVWSLQRVSVDVVAPKLSDFAESHLLWCLISTGSECWFCTNLSDLAEWHLLWCLISIGSECWCATKFWFFWATYDLMSDLYRKSVLILCHQICLIFLSNICFGVWSLQTVSVNHLGYVFLTTFLVSHYVCRWYVACIVVIHCLAHHPKCFSLIVLILLVCSLWVCNQEFHAGSLMFYISLYPECQCWLLHQSFPASVS